MPSPVYHSALLVFCMPVLRVLPTPESLTFLLLRKAQCNACGPRFPQLPRLVTGTDRDF